MVAIEGPGNPISSGSDDSFHFDEGIIKSAAEQAARKLIAENANVPDKESAVWTMPEDSVEIQRELLAWETRAEESEPVSRKVAYAKEYLRRRSLGIA